MNEEKGITHDARCWYVIGVSSQGLASVLPLSTRGAAACRRFKFNAPPACAAWPAPPSGS